MALNPIVFTEKVVRSFLRYQLTAYPFADARLHAQMRRLLSLDETRHSPLLKGPYISLSRPFRQGAAVEGMIKEGIFHPHMRHRIPSEITRIYGHQEEAVRAIHAARTTLVATGTGSGKTECFLYPVISKCLELRDEGADPGISAVIVYPMNALAEDQLGRLRLLLAGTGISFGMYVGKTPEREAEVTGFQMPAGSSLADYEAKLAEIRKEKRSDNVDEEELRFQMGVAVYGMERDRHNGGQAYRWGVQTVHHRRGVRLRMVNVGSTTAIDRFDRIGYPVCRVCGQSISPLSSERQREHFMQTHQERCGKPIIPVGFFADVVADVLSLPACTDQTTAYSVLEAMRFAAARVLDMHLDDLQILVIGHVDRDEVDALLWDPMPGGSGLLDQICDRFEEIAAVAQDVVQTCPAVCEKSCIDCLQTFRNGYYHKYLDRKVAQERLAMWGRRLSVSHEIPV